MQYFIVWAKKAYHFNTIKSTLSATTAWQRSKGLGFDVKDHADIKNVMRSVQVQLGSLAQSVQKKGLPLATLVAVVKLLLRRHIESLLPPAARTVSLTSDIWINGNILLLRDLVWIVLSFYALLRRSEATALSIEDIAIVSPLSADAGDPHLSVFIKKSKTDRNAKGVSILLAWSTHSGIPIGPIVQQYLSALSRLGSLPSSPLFPQWGPEGK